MYLPQPTQLYLVAAADVAERRAEADRLARRTESRRRPSYLTLLTPPQMGRLIPFPEPTPPAPKAA
jgi:hypothetical protein